MLSRKSQTITILRMRTLCECTNRCGVATLVLPSQTLPLRPILSVHRTCSAPSSQSDFPLRDAAALTVITLLSFLLLGYHPFAEDAGIYRSGINLALDPALYPASGLFILAHMHHTLFPYFFALVTQTLHLPLAWILLCAHVALLWLLLYAARRIAVLCFAHSVAQWTAVALTAFSLAIPVAGTALTLADPYLTPRSFATSFTLLLLCAVLDLRPRLAALSLLIAGCFHPLMAIYAAAFALVLWTVHARRLHGTLRLCLAAVLGATILALTQQGVGESPAYIHAALTRTYFYLSDWQWYELAGLAAPLAIFVWIYWIDRAQPASHARNRAAFAGTALACGMTAILISAIFVQPASRSHLLARLQPLRIFHTIYILLFILLGGMLAERLPRRIQRPGIALVLCTVAGIMFFVERQTFPASAHLEMPWRAPRNPWQQAFLWARDNTPQNAIFALDANYITRDGEDAQNFRAIAQRSALPDYSKDGGSSAIFPQLAAAWQDGEQRSADISTLTDTARINRLAPGGVTWIVLQEKYQQGSVQTHLPCPYRNNTVLICRLPAN
jgi:hypothetical protein